MEDTGRDRLRTRLGELLNRMVGVEEVANRIVQEYPEFEAMAEAVREAAETVAMAHELEAHRESDDLK
jgi:hypothetical protein